MIINKFIYLPFIQHLVAIHVKNSYCTLNARPQMAANDKSHTV